MNTLNLNAPDTWDIEIRSMFHRAPQWDMVSEDIELNGRVTAPYVPTCQSERELECQELDEWIAESADMLEDRPCAHILRMDECLNSGEAEEEVPHLASLLIDRKAEAEQKTYLLENPRPRQMPLGVFVNRHHEPYSI